MTSWQTKKLGDVAEITKGKGLSKDDIVGDGKYPCIHYGELFTKYNEVIKEVKSRTNLSEGVVLSVANDVLMPTSDVTPRGLATASTLPFSSVVIGGDVLIIRPDNDKLDGRFFAYFVAGDKHAILRLTTGSTIFHLYGSDMKKLKLNLPEKPEQERIVGVLKVWDEYIEKLEQKIALKEQLKKGLMQQLLTGKRRLPGFLKEWKAHKLGDFLQEPVYKRENNPKDIELLTVRLHAKGVQATGKFPFATEKGRPYYRRFQGEILIGRQNFHNGGVGTVTKKTHGLIASNAISSYVPKLNANLDFMLFALQRGDFYKRIGHIIGGTGQKEISPSEFKKLKIIMPELEEQEAIASVLKKSNEELQTLYVYAKYINQQKQYLLKNLITGTIRTPEDLQPLDASRLERSAL